jgi:two-component system, NtrC family, response regulator GlrR
MTHQMLGESKVFLTTQCLIGKIGRCDAPVLIEGETGTGKELAARSIHYGSARRDGPFVPVNCGAIPDALVENELFGHKRGAYTDARNDQTGLVALAGCGTLFLDEVDSLSSKAQVTLLRFLQDHHYRPLGGNDTRVADVRLITATNANLERLAERNVFRRDLYYRLNLLYVRMPSLRERGYDSVLLANHFLRQCAARFGLDKRLDKATQDWFVRYHWPGNVRELENLVCREYLLADEPLIHISSPAASQDVGVLGSHLSKLGFAAAKGRAIAEFERRYLTDALAAAGGNVTRAARLAQKERRAFGKLLKKYGVERGERVE